MSITAGENILVPFTIGQTDLLAGTSAELIAPVDGFVNELHVIVQVGVTTGGDVTVKVKDGDDITDVEGLKVTVPSAAAKGKVYKDAATAGHSSRAVSKGDRIQVLPSAAFDTAGAINGFVVINTAI